MDVERETDEQKDASPDFTLENQDSVLEAKWIVEVEIKGGDQVILSSPFSDMKQGIATFLTARVCVFVRRDADDDICEGRSAAFICCWGRRVSAGSRGSGC